MSVFLQKAQMSLTIDFVVAYWRAQRICESSRDYRECFVRNLHLV